MTFWQFFDANSFSNQGADFILEQAAEALGAVRAGLPRPMPPDVLTFQNGVPHPISHQGHSIRG